MSWFSFTIFYELFSLSRRKLKRPIKSFEKKKSPEPLCYEKHCFHCFSSYPYEGDEMFGANIEVNEDLMS